jgi:hypothetical protein
MAPADKALPDLVPAVRALSRADKLRLIQLLVTDLAREEGVPLHEPSAPYPVWTPHHAFDAAAVLLRELAAEGAGA